MIRPEYRYHLLLAFMLTASSRGFAADPAEERFFRERIEPVLKAACYECHSADAAELQAGLRLRLARGDAARGRHGPGGRAGQEGESLLVQAIRHEDGLEMPPKKPRLAEATIADFVNWIDLGAPDPRPNEPARGTVAAEPGPPALGVPAGAEVGSRRAFDKCGGGEPDRRVHPARSWKSGAGSLRRRRAGASGSAGSRST